MELAKPWRRLIVIGIIAVGIVFLLAACNGDSSVSDSSGDTGLVGTIEIDGSSTVAPISEAVAEEFLAEYPDVRVNVGVSGTGGGFKRFTVGETEISDASRPIKDSEAEIAAENGIEYLELTVALDGLAVMVNTANDFVDCLTIAELNEIWKPNSTVDSWDDVRAGFPSDDLNLYGPDTESGTFDYFTDVVNGDEGVSRSDYVASSDDNVLVRGISGDRNSLGYFGYAYYTENASQLKLVEIDGGNGCIAPSDATVADGSYAPLARPIFIYVDVAKLRAREELKAFVDFYLDNSPTLVPEVGYTALSSYAEEKNRVEDAYTGT
ncbi:MAG: PstS family phosphate ABC transporter substrate-binding protein [Dehalococcoidia bacterium]|nr:PstS family phosphate ABC transporter substrate-binding protein [Dehalococcoidia bacterium]